MNKTEDQLKDSSHFNERIALLGALSVVVGVALEVVFAAFFHEPPETLLSHWGPVFADAMVMIGVAVEVYFGREARLASDELSRISEQKVGQAVERAADAEKAAAEANAITAKIQQQNLRFREALLPRILDQTLASNRLKQFADMPFAMFSPIDFEPNRTRLYIRGALKSAGWKEIPQPYEDNHFFDGVTVHAGRDMEAFRDPKRMRASIDESNHRHDAAEALVAALNEGGIEAQMGAVGEVPAILIKVGPKPLPEGVRREFPKLW